MPDFVDPTPTHTGPDTDYAGHVPAHFGSCSFLAHPFRTPSQANTRRSVMVGGDACRSSAPHPWVLNEPVSGYTAPRRPVYASIVSLGGEGGRPPGYYAPQVAVSISPVGLRGQLGTRAFTSSAGNHIYLRNLNFPDTPLLESHMTRPRSRKTVCVGESFSLPTLHEENPGYGRARSASVVMGTQAISLTSQKVNNIEKAKKMKTQKTMKITKDDDVEVVEVHHNIKNFQAARAIEVSRSSMKMGRKSDSRALKVKPFAGNCKHVSFCEPPASLSGPRVRLSYVESIDYEDNTPERPALTKKRLSWAAGEKTHNAPPLRPPKSEAVLNNESVQGAGVKSRLSEATTVFPRTESCINIHKFKKRFSWATSEKKRFSWSPRGISAARRSADQRRYSVAGEENRRSAIRMGTRSLVSISSPVAGSLVHLAGHGPQTTPMAESLVHLADHGSISSPVAGNLAHLAGHGPHANIMLAAIIDHHRCCFINLVIISVTVVDAA